MKEPLFISDTFENISEYFNSRCFFYKIIIFFKLLLTFCGWVLSEWHLKNEVKYKQ